MELFERFWIIHHLHLLVVESLGIDRSKQRDDQYAHLIDHSSPYEDGHEPAFDKFLRLIWSKQNKTFHGFFVFLGAHVFYTTEFAEFER